MSLLSIGSYVFINVYYLVLFVSHVSVNDVIEKKMFCLVGELSLKLRLLFGSFAEYLTILTT